jgi:hypothetical protein
MITLLTAIVAFQGRRSPEPPLQRRPKQHRRLDHRVERARAHEAIVGPPAPRSSDCQDVRRWEGGCAS